MSLAVEITTEQEKPKPAIGQRGAVSADRLKLRRQARTAEAFQEIARHCLRQLLANEAGVRRQNPEAVHQMRVALRRLRAALALFSAVVSGREVDAVKADLKWLTGKLAQARDLDVFVAEAIAPAEQLRRGAPGLGALRVAAERRRAAAFARARRAVDSPAFRRRVRSIAAFVEEGRWLRKGGKWGEQRRTRIAKRAARELERRLRKVRRRGRRLRELAPRPRHKLRVQVKTIRYGIGFFRALFRGSKAGKRRKTLVAVLKRLQASLGGLTDIAVWQRFEQEMIENRDDRSPARAGQRRAFAAGRISGTQEARAEELMAEAEKASRALGGVRPFWK